MSTNEAPATQRAQVLEAFTKPSTVTSPYTFKPSHPAPPAPNGHQLLIRVLAASYCHTDAVFASGAMQQDLPRIGSHEFAGVIHSFGNDAASSTLGLKEGMLVGVPGRAFECCGECLECKENGGDPAGYGVWCTRAGNLGLSRDGGFQEWCLVDSRQVAPVPEGMKAIEVAPLMCAGVTIWSAIETAGVDMEDPENNRRRGLVVGIVGAGGGLGHLGVQFARRLGCEVVAVDQTNAIEGLAQVVSSIKGAKVGGGIHVVDSVYETVEMTRKRAFKNGREDVPAGEVGCDAVIILPEAQAAFDFGMALLKNHGTCVVVSFPKEGWHFQPRDLVFRHIKMTGVLVGRNRQLKAMLKFAAENKVRATIKTFALEDLNELVGVYHQGNFGKLVVDMEKPPQP